MDKTIETPATNGRARRDAENRARIVAAATDLFLREGYGRVTMDRVLAQVGGSKRTLYRHFASKDALFSAIVTGVSDRVLAALAPAPEDTDVRTALTAMGIRYLTVLLSPEGLALYRAMVSEAPHFPELSKAFFRNGPGRASDYLSRFIRDQVGKGALDVADTTLAASQFLGAVRGDVHLSAVLSSRRPTKRTIRRSVEQAVDTFLAGAGA